MSVSGEARLSRNHDGRAHPRPSRARQDVAKPRYRHGRRQAPAQGRFRGIGARRPVQRAVHRVRRSPRTRRVGRSRHQAKERGRSCHSFDASTPPPLRAPCRQPTAAQNLRILHREFDLCCADPGIDTYFLVTTDLRTVTANWMGLTTGAANAAQFEFTGSHEHSKAIQTWLGLSPFAIRRKLVAEGRVRSLALPECRDQPDLFG